MPRVTTANNGKGEVERDRELAKMTADQLRSWVRDEVALSHQRESIRTAHACRLDDTLRSLIDRLQYLIKDPGLPNEFVSRLNHTIYVHLQMWDRAVSDNPNAGGRLTRERRNPK